MKTNHKRFFLIISLMIFLADALFVVINYNNDRRTLESTLTAEGQQLEKSFQVALSMTLNNMSQVATFVAGTPDVQRLFAHAEQANRAEGGGAGGPESAAIRTKLYDRVSPGWKKMTEEYQVRQLHFHLGPGSTSFLRVHKPEKFGDNMDQLRHMVVDVNRDGEPRQGLELGRVYAGLRGIVPVFSDQNPEQQVGVVEVGTSFATMIDSLRTAIGFETAVLLNEKRVDSATWRRPQEPLRFPCGCFVEATSSSQLSAVMAERTTAEWSTPLSGTRTLLQQTRHGAFVVTEFAISDYIGIRDQHRAPVGRVVIWRSADHLLSELYQQTWLNILFAIVGFLLIEMALYAGINLALQQLETTVDERTQEIQALNKQLESMAHKDVLTGVCRRGYFMERLSLELNRARREKSALTLLMLDVDHFKHINDRWGHLTGDRVLADLGRVMRDNSREYDIVGRYGGEEFCVLLPGAGLGSGYQVAENLRKIIEDQVRIPDDAERPVTVSIGVASYVDGTRAEDWFKTADEALYRAKRGGRNRTEVGGKEAAGAEVS